MVAPTAAHVGPFRALYASHEDTQWVTEMVTTLLACFDSPTRNDDVHSMYTEGPTLKWVWLDERDEVVRVGRGVEDVLATRHVLSDVSVDVFRNHVLLEGCLCYAGTVTFFRRRLEIVQRSETSPGLINVDWWSFRPARHSQVTAFEKEQLV